MLIIILVATVIATHIAFIVFALFGALLVIKWRKIFWPHLLSVFWIIFIEFGAWCPLTSLEHFLRDKGHLPNYNGAFIPHYFPGIYNPVSKIPNYILIVCIILFNLLTYSFAFEKMNKPR